MEIERINFQDNWNNKLLGDVFSTIRPVSKKYELSKRYAIYLRDRFFCYVDVVGVDEMSLQEIVNRRIHLLDTGKNEKFFLELMESFYGKKPWWKGADTQMSIIYLKKITQTNLFDQI